MAQEQANHKDSVPPVFQHNNNLKKKRKRYLGLLALIVLIGLLTSFLYYFLHARYYESTDDAYVTGDIIPVNAKVSGTVSRILADSGDYVTSGQILVQLEPHDNKIALDLAKENLANVVREVRGLYSQSQYQQFQVNISQVAYQQALKDYQRRTALANKGAISGEDYSHALDSFNTAKNAYQAALYNQQISLALIDRTELINHPKIRYASAQLKQAYLAYQRTVILAPVSGYIAKRTVEIGQQIETNTSLLTLVPLDGVWIDANFKENQLREMRIGQTADIRIDLYGKQVRYRGEVASLGIGTGSVFALLPAQNASGNWIKIVQRLPVKIKLDAEQIAQYPLRLGLSADVNVDLHDQYGPLLAQQVMTQPKAAPDSDTAAINEADKLVSDIIAANINPAPIPLINHDE